MLKATMAAAMAAAMTAASAAAGQQLTTWQVDNGTTSHRNEVALRVSHWNEEVMVAWHDQPTQQFNAVHYRVTVDGITWGADSGPVPLPPQTGSGGADPMIAYARDGSSKVGYYASLLVPDDRFRVADKVAGQVGANPAQPVIESGFHVDKGVLAAGPPPEGGSDQFAMVYVRKQSSTGPARLRAMIAPPSTSFPVGQDPEGNIGGPNSVIITRGGSNIGRWVVAYYEAPSELIGYMPSVTYRESNGQWFNSQNPPRRATIHHSSGQTEQISWLTPSPNPEQDPLLYSVLPPGGPYVFNAPSLFADPTHPEIVYMAFLGRTMTGSYHDQSQLDNIDLFIAKSTDGGINFSGPAATPGSQVLRLRDVEDLNDPPQSIQFLPAITVDADGGVHVFYYVAYLDDATWKYRVKKASLAVFSTDPGDEAVWTTDLTDEFDMTGAFNLLRADRTFFGDYIMADARGCELWVGYVARPAGAPCVRTYVTKVNLCIDADMNHDGALTGADPARFAEFFIQGHPRADVNRSAQVDAGDITSFVQSFACACNPP